MFASALPILTELTSPRAWAFGLIGIHEYLRRLNGDSMVSQTRDILTSRLMEIFEKTAQPGWQWFEESLSYDNAKLPHALILTGSATGQQAVFEQGLESLRWLTELQLSEKGHFRPIGTNGFYRRGGTRASFDQQPVEAQSTVSACLAAYRATSDRWWYKQAQRAFDWFIGWNDLGLELYSPETGGCLDGLHVDRVNGNQGAESKRYEQVRESLPRAGKISPERVLLIGSYFMAEYSLESAALFNPSIVPHPDQSRLPSGALRFILSLRATGEGHISSITFRTGLIQADSRIEVEEASGFLTEPRQTPNPQYEKPQFTSRILKNSQ